MSSLLKEEYIHFGTDKIYYELWHNIYMPQNGLLNYSKPIGGLWASKKNDEYICDWLEYIEEKDPHNFDYYVANKQSSIIKFKETTRFLKIETEEDYTNLKNSGFIIPLQNPIKIAKRFDYLYIHEIPDYEKISEYYDLIYVNKFVHSCFNQFSVDTMLALVPSSIEYYKPVIANYLNHEIINVGEKQFITKPTQDYYDFLEYIKSLIQEIKASSYEEFVEKLTKIRISIINDLHKNFDISNLALPDNIDKEHFMYATVTNTINQKIKELKKIYIN